MSTAVRLDDSRVVDQLREMLLGRNRGGAELVKVTRADVSAMTGAPIEQAEPALKSLAKTYRSHMMVTDEGELIYAFDPSFERRDAVPLRERLQKGAAAAYRGFQFLFKIGIMVTLVAYFLLFVAILIGLMLAKNSSDDRDGGGVDFLPGLWYLWFPRPYGYVGAGNDWSGRRSFRARRAPKKVFYKSVFDFVFGPPGAPADPRADDRNFIAYVTQNKGYVTAMELVALTGWDERRTEEELTRLMIEYDGEVEVAEDGALLYRFDALVKQTGEVAAPTFTWAHLENAPALTGNTAGANVGISALNGFNLVAASLLGPQLAITFGAAAFLYIVPLVFSSLLFAIPVTRAVVESRRKRRRNLRNVRRLLLREILNRSQNATIDPVEACASVAAELGIADVKVVAAQLDRLLAEFGGEVITDDAGGVKYCFERWLNERTAVQTARLEKPVSPLGEVIFSSAD